MNRVSEDIAGSSSDFFIGFGNRRSGEAEISCFGEIIADILQHISEYRSMALVDNEYDFFFL